MTKTTEVRLVGVLSVLFCLTGCLPVPVLPFGDRDGSRQNITDQVPGFIAVGKTTRAEVLLTLGEPDQKTDNDDRFQYVRASEEGGVGFMFGGAGRGGITGVPVTIRVLSVSFDGKGVVSGAQARRFVTRDFGPHISPRLHHEPWPLQPNDSPRVE